MNKKIVFWITFFLFACICHAQETLIKGLVTDSITGEGLPYASLIFKGTSIGTSTDLDGNFSLSTETKESILEVSYLGYQTQTLKVILGKTNLLHIKLSPNDITLQEVIVKPKKEKYNKKDNPAVQLVRKVIALRKQHNPYHSDFFQYDSYEKMTFALNEYQPKPKKNGEKGKFDFLTEFIDTLETGTTILPVSEKEKIETVFYRKNPQTIKRLVTASQSAGIDDMFSRDGIQQFLNEVFKEVDIFQNDIPLFLQRFVSPLSNIATNYYKYYLLDTLKVNNQPCVDLGFVPFNSETFGFTGHLYITLDSTYFVQKAILNVPKDINLNFVSQLNITQDFQRMADSTRLITKNDIQVNFKLSERSKGMYARRLNIYSNHSFQDPDTLSSAIFNEKLPVITRIDANQQTDEFWKKYRPEEVVKKNPNSVGELMKRLRSIPVFYYTEKAISILFSGYMPTHKDPLKSKFEFGPMNASIGGNELEGFRMRIGGTTTPAFSKNLFLEGYAAYGTRDNKLKYNLLVEYSFNDRKEFRKEFPLNSIRFEYTYDVNKLGEQYMYTGKDNFLLSIKRMKEIRATYMRQAEIAYYQENYNGFAFGATFRNRREYATPYARFLQITPGRGLLSRSNFDMSQLELKFRYAKDEKFYQTRDLRIPITFDALIINANHIMAKKNLIGSAYDYHRTDIGIQKRFWFSAFGYLDVITKAGKVWTKVPYPLLILPNANLSYTIQPESYTNMNPLEFINDEYVSWDLTYYMNGNLLNRIPFLKKLKWREVFCFRGLKGNLTEKNDPIRNKEELYLFPEGSYTMGNTPYMEASIGFENIFKVLRVDYVWRLNYLNHPNIQKRGIRATIKMSF